MEEELFGVEGGDGRGRRIGALEEAHGGSLYIDEIGDMPVSYTHLDVYKRQNSTCRWSARRAETRHHRLVNVIF